jgi:CheY-like chemotaxis protein
MSTPLRVLIVEDSEDDTLLIVRELRRGGYDPTFERVDTPGAMSAAIAQQTWDIIIADYHLPRFSGLAALMLMQEGGLDLPFIIVSGTIGEETAVAAMKAGLPLSGSCVRRRCAGRASRLRRRCGGAKSGFVKWRSSLLFQSLSLTQLDDTSTSTQNLLRFLATHWRTSPTVKNGLLEPTQI